MNKISEYIGLLLQSHECVIVPGLGAFVVRNERARVVQHTIYPPHRVISFNSSLSHNDGFLASKCAQMLGVNYAKALVKIEEFVDNLLIRLSENEKVSIGTVGCLFRNAAHQVEFEVNTGFVLPDNFGLIPLRLVPLRSEQTTQITLTLPVQTKSWIRYAAVWVLFVMLFFVPTGLDDKSIHHYSSLSPVNWTAVLANQKRVQLENENRVADSLKQVLLASEREEMLDNGVERPEQSTYKYHLVVASLTRDAARDYCQELIARDYEGASVISHRNLHRVALMSFRTREEAIKKMRSIRNTHHKFKKAWVYCE